MEEDSREERKGKKRPAAKRTAPGASPVDPSAPSALLAKSGADASPAPAEMQQVYDYFDYRKLLRDLFEARKRVQPSFSYRFVARRAGFASPSFITLILQGKSNVSLKIALKLAEVLKLRKDEARYFELLVQFNQAGSQSEKKHFFDELVTLRRAKVKALDTSQYELFSEWHNLVVHEVLGYHLFSGNFRELGQMLSPPISAQQARKAVEILEKVGLIRKNPYGYYEQIETVLSTGDAWQSQAIANFQVASLEQSRGAFDLFPRKRTDISTLTVSLSEEGFGRVRDRLKALRREILEISRHENRADRVYQINFQAFPATRVDK